MLRPADDDFVLRTVMERLSFECRQRILQRLARGGLAGFLVVQACEPAAEVS